MAARNGAGSVVSDRVTVNTGRAGSVMCVKVFELNCIGGESSFSFFEGGDYAVEEYRFICNKFHVYQCTSHTTEFLHEGQVRVI